MTEYLPPGMARETAHNEETGAPGGDHADREEYKVNTPNRKHHTGISDN